MNWEDPKIQAAVISAFVSVVIVLLSFLFKSFFERHFHIFKLESEHEYEQRKKIKEVIAKYKTQLLDAAESLNHRLWNFTANYNREWHTAQNLKLLPEHYYLASFTYRLLAFFAWLRKVEREMIYLDSTIATRQDLNFVKYLKLFPHLMCDVALFDGLDYNTEFAKDHFFRNDLLHICDQFCSENGVIQFSEFKEDNNQILQEILPIADFISGMSPSEDRLRWDRLQALHFILMIFLNSYGYDFQYTDEEKISEIASRTRPSKVVPNLRNLLNRFGLGNDKEVKKTLDSIERSNKRMQTDPAKLGR